MTGISVDDSNSDDEMPSLENVFPCSECGCENLLGRDESECTAEARQLMLCLGCRAVLLTDQELDTRGLVRCADCGAHPIEAPCRGSSFLLDMQILTFDAFQNTLVLAFGLRHAADRQAAFDYHSRRHGLTQAQREAGQHMLDSYEAVAFINGRDVV